MTTTKTNPRTRGLALAMAALAFVILTFWSVSEEPTSRVIVQGHDAAIVAELVRSVGGTVTHELGIIRAVGARLTTEQRVSLARQSGLRLFVDASVATTGAGVPSRSSPR